MSNTPNSKKTIAVFTNMYGNYQDALCNGIMEVAIEHDVNVIFFNGAGLNDQLGYRKYWNIIYDLAKPSSVDGLIVFTAAIKEFVTMDELHEFFEHYQPLPTISINQYLDNTPSVLMDSIQGLRDMMEHLINHHGYKRIAFIRGPENFDPAEERYRCYREGLEANGIPFDPELVTSGDFLPESGTDAVKLLLDERKVQFDAIFAANDGMAFAAWEELNKRGIHVPSDIALVGFDDVIPARSFSVPLTTINTSLPEQGRQATLSIINSIKTQTPPRNVSIDTPFVLRESCGCLPIPYNSTILSDIIADNPQMTVKQQRATVFQTIQNLIIPSFPIVKSEALQHIIDLFYQDVLEDKSSSQFLLEFNRLLQISTAHLTHSQIEQEITSKWRDVISVFRELYHYNHTPDSPNIETVFHQANSLVNKTVECIHADLRNWAENDLRIQAEMIRDINTAGDINQIIDVLAENFPRLGIETYAIVFYEGDSDELNMGRLMMACNNGQHIDIEEGGLLFSVDELVPPHIIPRENNPLLTLHPLGAREDQFGYILMQVTQGHWSMYNAYLVTAEQIGVALHGVMLQQEIKHTNITLQKSMIELAETNQQLEDAREEADRANQVKSQFLAAMSHELRTPLNGIVNFTRFVADGMLGEINDRQADALQKSVLSSKHLLDLINDVLDISKIESGSLKLLVEDGVDIEQELIQVVATGEVLLDGKPVELKLDVEDNLPSVRGDKRRIKQIMLNILSNACKFTDEGHIVVRACQQDADLLISITDTGPGIAREDINNVFETFTQTESGIRKGGGTGLGMPISRRLAEAHGGSMWLESEVGKGSTFFVRLPIKHDSLIPTFNR